MFRQASVRYDFSGVAPHRAHRQTSASYVRLCAPIIDFFGQIEEWVGGELES
jgi:hypothetical protein